MPIFIKILHYGGRVIAILLCITAYLAKDFSYVIGGLLVYVSSLLLGALYYKLEDWGLISPPQEIQYQPRSEIFAQTISDILQPEESTLPPANAPPPLGPVKGVMRVDITQTNKTVDVYIVLSQQSKFLVDTYHLGSAPIEQNLEGLREHMTEFKRRLLSLLDESDANYSRIMSSNSQDIVHDITTDNRAQDKANLPALLSREEAAYKNRNTVSLQHYLQHPYRKVVKDHLDSSEYIKRLQSDYLPRIKAIIESSAEPQVKTLEY
jgi:hypothetical protein